MVKKIVQQNEEVIKGQLIELMRGSIEEMLNDLLENDAEKLTQAVRYERNEQRQGYRSGHYTRNSTITSVNAIPKCRNSKESLWGSPSLSGIAARRTA